MAEKKSSIGLVLLLAGGALILWKVIGNRRAAPHSTDRAPKVPGLYNAGEGVKVPPPAPPAGDYRVVEVEGGTRRFH